MKSLLTFMWEVFKITVIALAIILPVRYFLIQPFFVKGASMEPNFEDGQYLIINEISYRFSDPKRGDVVIFRYPQDESQFFIKRVIGLPGERIEILNGQVRIFNSEHPLGFVLDESDYIPGGIRTSGEISQSLGLNDFFVLGDNRQSSSDSRFWGILPRKNILGKVFLRAWPPQTLEVFGELRYSN